jgi:hypothetical protein
MKRKLVALMALLASLSLAQTTDSHNVTVNIPQFLKLTLDATDYVFNFGSNASGTVSVNSVNYPKASLTAYEAFLAGSATTPDFAPSTVTGGTGNEYGTLEIVTNQSAWTVKIQSIGTPTFPALTLGNDRVKVFAEKVSGKGSSQTSTPTSIAANLALAKATSSGQGKSTYKLYYLFEMNVNDDIPTTGLNESIQITLVLTAP